MKTCPINSLAKYDVGKVDDPELCEHLKFNIFESIGDGREFVYKFHPNNLYAVYAGKNLVGRSLGDVFPQLKDFYYPIFRRVLKTCNTERILEITKKRLKSLALIHETIYGEEDLSSIMLHFFFNDFDNKLFMFSTSDDIKFDNDIDNGLKLSVNKLTPLTLMVNELTTNSFKYAFPDDFSGVKKIFKSIHVYDNNGLRFCEFKYSDSGVGLPDDFDLDNVTSLGWIIIKSLIGQLDGEFELFNDNGFNLVMKFPIN